MTTPKYRDGLPQASNQIFLTDGGIETTLIYHDGVDLPCFAAFTLLDTPVGTELLRAYFARYAGVALRAGHGFVLESPTWRASADWGAKVGYSRAALAEINRKAIALMHDLRNEFETPRTPLVISGNIGPRGDGYDPGRIMSADDAQAYHAEQIGVFSTCAVDLVSAFTLSYVNEAIGVARAARAAGMPVVISFTVETDGRLPTGEMLEQAIAQVDAATDRAPVYYMINCAHPTHFSDAVAARGDWVTRIGGLRANASRRSHAELDQATELDAGDPVEFGRQYADLRRLLPRATVLGGCCGTDHRHVEQIAFACNAVA
ncbi:MAG TPA: homocysteine S-methyltransferase family protein [Pseudolabrys sp.]|jgi:S-methylmethionine-dependent homocysteine/selenocysteine methylase|nr:homocysteine S-methyltransferase family protein [Pseudolabrys sp.]